MTGHSFETNSNKITQVHFKKLYNKKELTIKDNILVKFLNLLKRNKINSNQ